VYIWNPQKRLNEVDEFLTPTTVATQMAECIPFSGHFAVLDPGANTGRIGEAVRAQFPENMFLVGVDLLSGVPVSPAYDVYFDNRDYLTWENNVLLFDVVISNPPYSRPHKDIAEKFVHKSLAMLVSGGYGIFLLRTNFLNSRGRYKRLWKKGMGLREVRVLVKRPSFYDEDMREEDHHGTGHTNMHDYSIFIFEKGYKGQPLISWASNEN